MTAPIFPALAGQGWSVRKRPTWRTNKAEHVSGREVRSQPWQNPRWEFELVFEGLDGTSTGQYGGLGAASLQTLMGFFLQCGGMAQTFIYYDPTDYVVTGQVFGFGDGTTTQFQLVRTLGGFGESVAAPVISSATLCFPGGQSANVSAPAISVGGAVALSSTYSVSCPGGMVNFATAPSSGAALRWTGAYGFLCRFDEDKLDFEQFMSNLWRADSLKFTSVRAF